MESDCYALGMVIYEVLSGRAPFSGRPGPEVVFLVLQGNRPQKLQGSEAELFTDEIWEMLELCWSHLPTHMETRRQVSMVNRMTRRTGLVCFSHPASSLSLTIPKPRQDRHVLALTRSAEFHSKLLILGVDWFISWGVVLRNFWLG